MSDTSGLIVRDVTWLAATATLAERALIERESHRTYEQLRLWGGRDLIVAPRLAWYYRTISEALADARAGDHIRIAPGHYVESLIVTKDVVIEPALRDRGGVAIFGVDAPAVTVIGGSPAFHDLQLGAGGPTRSALPETRSTHAALHVLASNATLSKVEVTGWGAVIEGGQPHLLRCYVHPTERSYAGIRLVGGTRALVDDCHIDRSDGHGIVIEGTGTAPSVVRSRVRGSCWVGVYVTQGARPLLNENVISDNTEAGLWWSGGGGIAIRNWISSNGVGIQVAAGDPRLLSNHVDANRIADIKDHRDALITPQSRRSKSTPGDPQPY